MPKSRVLIPSLLFALISSGLFNFQEPQAEHQVALDSSCLSYEPSVVNITGTIVRETGRDALDKPEIYRELQPLRPICVHEDTKQPDLNHAQRNISAIQLVFQDQKAYTTYKNLLGKRVVASGTLFAAITVHHHTPVLLAVNSLKATR